MRETSSEQKKTNERSEEDTPHYDREISFMPVNFADAVPEEQEEPSGLGLRPGVSAQPTTPSEASRPVPVSSATISEYKEPRLIDTTNMSERGKQFFSKCPA